MGCWSLRSYISPGQLIIFSILVAICLGTAALWFTDGHVDGARLIDLFFTATSAVCVTGLSSIPFSDFSPYGHLILLILIQIGGLGLITITLFFMYLLLNVGLAGGVIASQILEIDSWRDVRRTIIMIMLFTLACELLGTAGLYWLVHHKYSGYHALFFAAFHAVSAFCNAGIVLTSDIVHDFGTSPLFLTIIGLLMLGGGLGFFTWYEIGKMVQNTFQRKRFRFSLQSTLTIKLSALLIATTTTVYYLIERYNTLAEESFLNSLGVSLFHAISFRSAGFLIIPSLMMLHPATILFLFMIGFIGSAAGSTGSGIKITTFAVVIAAIKSAVTGRDEVEIAHRTIAHDQVYKAIAIAAVSLCWVVATTFILLITEQGLGFGELFFEAVSAFSCVGVSVDVTESLSDIGKIVIMASMIAGRIGSLTVLLGLKIRRPEGTVKFSYPEERVLLG